MDRIKTDYLEWIFLIGIVLLLLELTLFDGGLLFSLALSACFIYIGKRFRHRTIGRILFYIGAVSLVFTVLNMYFLKFLLFAILIYFLLSHYKSKKNPKWIKPALLEEQLDKGPGREKLIKKEPLFQNKLWGRQRTPEHVFEWNSVNVQDGVGDTVIDISNTILPKGDSVISIRKMVGNITILIPYGIDVHVHHTVLAGRSSIFENRSETRVFNQVLSYHTENFGESAERVQIFISVLVGDLEVKRI